jgi:hypothetical protein
MPYLGGKYQTQLKERITVETEVMVTNNAVMNLADSIIDDEKRTAALKVRCEKAGICYICCDKLEENESLGGLKTCSNTECENH